MIKLVNNYWWVLTIYFICGFNSISVSSPNLFGYTLITENFCSGIPLVNIYESLKL